MEAASGRARPRRPGTAGDGQSGGGGGRRRVAGEEHPLPTPPLTPPLGQDGSEWGGVIGRIR